MAACVPESVEYQRFPRYTAASIFEPSPVTPMADQWGGGDGQGDPQPGSRPVTSFQVAPESAEYQMFSEYVAAACLTPSADMAIWLHRAAVVPTSSFHVAPESVDLQMFSL